MALSVRRDTDISRDAAQPSGGAWVVGGSALRDAPQSSRHTRRRHTDLGSNVLQSQTTPPQLHDQAAASYTVRGRTNRYLSPSGNSHLFNTHRYQFTDAGHIVLQHN
jgi:hypothetical protein